MINILLAGAMGLSLLIPGRTEVYVKTMQDLVPPTSTIQVTVDKNGHKVFIDTAWSKERLQELTHYAEHPILMMELMRCESQFTVISRIDSNGVYSDGPLQFNRGPKNTMEGGTWNDMSQRSGIDGSPMDPIAAIKISDWMIDHGFGPRWSCWERAQKNVKKSYTQAF